MNVFTEVADDVTYVGYHKIESKIHKSYQILVRPDVSEDSLLTLTQQILITSSGAVTKHVPASGLENTHDHSHRHANMINGDNVRSTPSPTNAALLKETKATKEKGSENFISPYLEAVNSTIAGATLPWHVIRVYLGVNMDLQRCLVLSVQPTPAAAGTNTVSANLGGEVGVVQRSVAPGVFRGIGVNTYSHAAELSHSHADTTLTAAKTTAPYISATRRAFLDYCAQLAHELNTAMWEESLTVDYLTSVPASMTGPMQGLHSPYSTAGGAGRALDSLIDLAYIRDLHCSTVQLMTLRLLEQADKLDFRTKIIEQKCARLMTLLKPSYQRAKLDLPAPPTSRSVLHYELHLEKTAIGDSCTLDVWKLVLLRARRKCREVLQLRGQAAIGSGSSNSNSIYNIETAVDTRTETQIVLDCISEQFVSWARDEYKQRLFRKINSVKDRLETIHRFRLQLILNLHERFVVNGTSNSNTGSSWLFNSNPDLTYQRSVREKFPFLDLTEPVLFDTQAILLSSKYGLYDAAAAALNGKTGTLYLSLGYAMFYCGGGFLGSPAEIVVVPLHSVVLLELVGADGTLVSFSYSSDSSGGDSSVVDTGGVGSDGREGLSIHQGDKSVNILSPVKTHPNSSTEPAITSDPTNTTTTATTPKQIAPSARQPSTLRLVDSTATTDVTLTVTGLTEDYVRRVADLLDLIVKDKMYKLREPHAPAHTPHIASSEGSATHSTDSYRTIGDIDDIMHLLALPTSGASDGDGTSGSAGDKNGSVAGVQSTESSNTSAPTPTTASNSVSALPVLTAVNVGAKVSNSSVVRTPALLSTAIPATTTTSTTVYNTATPERTTTTAPSTTVVAGRDVDFDNLLLSTTHPTTNTNTATTSANINIPTTAKVLTANPASSTSTTPAENTTATSASVFDFLNNTTVSTTTSSTTVSTTTHSAVHSSSLFDTTSTLLLPTTTTTNTISNHTGGTDNSVNNTYPANTNATTTSTASTGLQRSESSHLAELDDFYNELTIHTPSSSLGGTGTHTPTSTSLYGSSAFNGHLSSSGDVFGSSSVLVPTGSGVLGYTNTSNSNSSNMLSHSSSTNMLNTVHGNSRSNNSISNINIELNPRPSATKPAGDLFNDLVFSTMSAPAVSRAPSASSPKIVDKIANGASSVVRAPALTSTGTAKTAPAPVAVAVTSAPTTTSTTSSTAKPVTPNQLTVGQSTTTSSAADITTPTNSTISTTHTTNTTTGTAPTPTPVVVPVGEEHQPAPAPVKKSLGGNIQKFLAQSQAQKAKQAAEAAKK